MNEAQKAKLESLTSIPGANWYVRPRARPTGAVQAYVEQHGIEHMVYLDSEGLIIHYTIRYPDRPDRTWWQQHDKVEVASHLYALIGGEFVRS